MAVTIVPNNQQVNEFPHELCFSDEHKKAMARAAALLDQESWEFAVATGMSLVTLYSQQFVKGNSCAIFCKPELDHLFQNYPEFFDALCKEGVVEWLMPLVLPESVN